MAVKFRVLPNVSWTTAETRNVGVGGAFIATEDVPPVGSQLAIELGLPTSDRMFNLPAVVRWIGSGGMGVQFVNVDVDILLELNDYFSTLTGA